MAAVTALALPAASRAEPYLAVRSGAKCVACHVNPTGGGKRTEFGSIYGQTELPARRLDLLTGKIAESGAGAAPWSGKLNDHVALGADFRANFDARGIPDAEDTNAFNTRGQVYLEVKPIIDRLTLYLDERVAPGTATSREAFGLLWFGNQAAYLKAGRMFVPFGLRIEDDTAFIREITGTTFSSSDDGIEGGLELGPWSAALAVTNGAGGGTETDRRKQVSALASYTAPVWRVGLSFSANSSAGAERTMQSVFGGLRTGPVSWIASAVWVTDDGGPTGRLPQWAGLAEANYNFARGHNLKLTYEYHDPDRDLREDQRERYSLVWEYMPFQFTQLRAGVRKNEGIPQDDLQNTTELFLQWHAFF